MLSKIRLILCKIDLPIANRPAMNTLSAIYPKMSLVRENSSYESWFVCSVEVNVRCKNGSKIYLYTHLILNSSYLWRFTLPFRKVHEKYRHCNVYIEKFRKSRQKLACVNHNHNSTNLWRRPLKTR